MSFIFNSEVEKCLCAYTKMSHVPTTAINLNELHNVTVNESASYYCRINQNLFCSPSPMLGYCILVCCSCLQDPSDCCA